MLDKNAMQRRINDLYAKEERDGDLTDAELHEQTRLFYELDPNSWYWRSFAPDMTPADIWPLPGEQEGE